MDLPEDAEIISRYLKKSGVPNKVSRINEKWVLWVSDAESVQPVQNLFQAIKKKQVSFKQDNSSSNPQIYLDTVVSPVNHLFFQMSQIRYWPITLSIVLMCLFIFFYSQGGRENINPFLFTNVSTSYILEFGLFKSLPFEEVWRFFSPSFLHFGWPHLLFNIFLMSFLGQRVEQHLKASRFIGLLIGIIFISNIAQFVMTGANFAGLSGVVYGLSGFCWMHDQKFKQSRLYDKQNLWFWPLMIWLLVGLCRLPNWMGFDVNMANVSHTIGLLIGGSFALTLSSSSRLNQRFSQSEIKR